MTSPRWDGTKWVELAPGAASPAVDERIFRQITEYVRDVFWLKAPGGSMLYVSPAYEHIWGRSARSLYENPASFVDSIHPDDRDRVLRSLERQVEGGYDEEYRIIRPDGTVRWVRDRAFPVCDEKGRVVRLAGIAQDVTRRKKSQAEIERREQWYRTLFENTSDFISVFDGAWRRITASPSVTRLLGYRPEELGEDAIPLVHPDDVPRVKEVRAWLEAHPGESARTEYRLRRKDGSYAYFESVVVRLRDPAGQDAFVVCARDITERRLVDPLTGLPNQNLLTHHLRMLAADRNTGVAEGCIALVLLGVDRFRTVNDTIGEADADTVLVEIGRRLLAHAPSPCFVARITGDRFAVVFEQVATREEAVEAARELQQVFDEPFSSRMGPLVLGAGVGMIVDPPVDAAPGDILRAAEEALAQAKRAGAGRLSVYEESMRRRAQKRLDLEGALHQALQGGEIITHFQPIYDLQTSRLASFEALARWQRPGEALMMPADFIPVAEESGLIRELDFAILRRACAAIVRWRATFSGCEKMAISVNLSARHFDDGKLAPEIEKVLTEAGAPTSAIHFEITESVVVSRPAHAAGVMYALGRKGLNFGLDDFGTGYASLASIHKFPFRTLKIDRSFVSSLDTPAGKPEIVRAIVGMARSLGLRTVAEGIETQAQLEAVRELGADFGQGFFLGRPMDEAAVEALLGKACKRRGASG